MLTAEQIKTDRERSQELFLKKLGTPGIAVQPYENRHINHQTREGNYYRLTVGLSVTAFFVGKDLESEDQIVEQMA